MIVRVSSTDSVVARCRRPSPDRRLERVDVGFGLNEHDHVGRLAHRALDLLVLAVADQHDRLLLGGDFLASTWTFVTSGQVASIVDSERSAAWAWTAGDTPWAEDGRRALGDAVVDLVDEDRSARAQLLDDVLVVDDLFAHVDRRAVQLGVA